MKNYMLYFIKFIFFHVILLYLISYFHWFLPFYVYLFLYFLWFEYIVLRLIMTQFTCKLLILGLVHWFLILFIVFVYRSFLGNLYKFSFLGFEMLPFGCLFFYIIILLLLSYIILKKVNFLKRIYAIYLLKNILLMINNLFLDSTIILNTFLFNITKKTKKKINLQEHYDNYIHKHNLDDVPTTQSSWLYENIYYIAAGVVIIIIIAGVVFVYYSTGNNGAPPIVGPGGAGGGGGAPSSSSSSTTSSSSSSSDYPDVPSLGSSDIPLGSLGETIPKVLDYASQMLGNSMTPASKALVMTLVMKMHKASNDYVIRALDYLRCKTLEYKLNNKGYYYPSENNPQSFSDSCDNLTEMLLELLELIPFKNKLTAIINSLIHEQPFWCESYWVEILNVLYADKQDVIAFFRDYLLIKDGLNLSNDEIIIYIQKLEKNPKKIIEFMADILQSGDYNHAHALELLYFLFVFKSIDFF